MQTTKDTRNQKLDVTSFQTRSYLLTAVGNHTLDMGPESEKWFLHKIRLVHDVDVFTYAGTGPFSFTFYWKNSINGLFQYRQYGMIPNLIEDELNMWLNHLSSGNLVFYVTLHTPMNLFIEITYKQLSEQNVIYFGGAF